MKVLLSNVATKATQLAKTLSGGEVIALYGNLGSGKTTFTKAVGKALSVKEIITSPTFVLMQQYKTSKKNSSQQPLWLYHLDLYRTDNFKEIAGLGIEEIWNKPETITIIEWADKIDKELPKNTIKIYLQRDVD